MTQKIRHELTNGYKIDEDLQSYNLLSGPKQNLFMFLWTVLLCFLKVRVVKSLKAGKGTANLEGRAAEDIHLSFLLISKSFTFLLSPSLPWSP